jgi:CubicO group peptidase (beta-lactamase class C family)
MWNRRDFLMRCAAGGCALRTALAFAEVEKASDASRPENVDLVARVLAVAAEHAQKTGGWGASVALSRGACRATAAAGYCDALETRPVDPQTLFRIASVTKPITAALVRTLVRLGGLALDDRAFDVLQLEPAPNQGDPRLRDITVEHLLTHQGGWDRVAAFDPMFHQDDIRRELDLPGRVGLYDIIRYMLGQPLQFGPGERKAYSNFGYCVLGRIIERVTEMPYADAMTTMIAAPLTIEVDLLLGRQKERQPRESDYSGDQQSFDLDVMDAHGGLIATPAALCRFLEAYWLSGEPRRPGDAAQEWVSYGSLPGTAAVAWQRRDGWNVAVLLNGRRDEHYLEDLDALKEGVGQVM